MDFFGIGFGEIVLILILGLIIFGPGKLPEVARTVGRYVRVLRKMSSEFTEAVKKEIDLDEDMKNLGSDLDAAKKQLTLREDMNRIANDIKTTASQAKADINDHEDKAGPGMNARAVPQNGPASAMPNAGMNPSVGAGASEPKA